MSAGAVMRWLAVLAVGVACGTALPAAADSLQRVFEDANAAYLQGDYARAVEGYRRLRQAGVRSTEVEHNLGLAHARRHEYGEAIAAFERVLRHDPDDADAQAAIEACYDALAASRTSGESVQRGPSLVQALAQPFSDRSLAWLLLLCDLLLFGGLAMWSRLPSGAWRTAAAIGLPLVSVLLVLSGTALAAKRGYWQEGRPVVVTAEPAPLLEGPDPRARERSSVLEGQQGRALGRDGEYVQVRLRDGSRGWMHRDDVEWIEAPSD